MILFFLLVLGILVYLFWIGRKKPKLAALIFLGLGLISAIILITYKDLFGQSYGFDEDSDEGKRIGLIVVIVATCFFLILGGYFLYKSTTKKS